MINQSSKPLEVSITTYIPGMCRVDTLQALPVRNKKRQLPAKRGGSQLFYSWLRIL
jgi:hypothetical protein